MYLPGENPQWATLTPFAMTSPGQFLPGGPPSVTSADYAAAVNETKSLGSATSTTRTADQTKIARFWADGVGTFTPPGAWNQIAEETSLKQGDSLTTDARLFAELNVAEADSAIAAWMRSTPTVLGGRSLRSRMPTASATRALRRIPIGSRSSSRRRSRNISPGIDLQRRRR